MPSLGWGGWNKSKSCLEECVGRQVDIKVTDPAKLGEGLTAYIGYQVSSTSASAEHESNQLTVTRRYKDFVWLHNALWKECAPGMIVPPLPEKALVWRFDQDEVELRRRALQNFLTRVATHPTLSTCKALKAFLAVDEETLTTLKENSAGSLQKEFFIWCTSAAQLVQSKLPSSATPMRPQNDNDDKVDAAREYISNLEMQINMVHKHTSELIKSKRNLATGLSEFATGVRTLGEGQKLDGAEHGEAGGLDAAVLVQLGNCAERHALMGVKEAQRESLYFQEPIKFYTQMITPLRRALAVRAEKTFLYEQALGDHATKTSLHGELAGVAGKEDNAAAVAVEVQRAGENVEEARRVYNETTETFLGEFQRFKRDKANDFAKLVQDYKDLQLEYIKQAEAAWRTL